MLKVLMYVSVCNEVELLLVCFLLCIFSIESSNAIPEYSLSSPRSITLTTKPARLIKLIKISSSENPPSHFTAQSFFMLATK